MAYRHRGPAPPSFRRPALSTVAVQRSRNSKIDPQAQWRGELEAAYIPRARKHFDGSRVRFHDDTSTPDPHRVDFQPGWRAAPRESAVERAILRISALLLIAGAVGCFWLLYTMFQMSPDAGSSRVAAQSPPHPPAPVIVASGKGDSLAVSTHLRADRAGAAVLPAAGAVPAKKEIVSAIDRNPRSRGLTQSVASAEINPASLVALEWGLFGPATSPSDRTLRDAKSKSLPPIAAQARVAALDNRPPPARVAVLEGAPPPTRLAALESPLPQAVAPRLPDALSPRLPPIGEAKMDLVGFQTSPFPYDGRVQESSRPFLNAGEEGHRGHTNFRGRVLWETDTFGDNRVLLHIPPAFDPSRPAVMVVFFHGHRATLARDVRDRQKVPAQIAASGANAVLVAPQFAVDAADSSAGKFWQPGGFKRFLDESAEQLARMYGDQRSAQAFANMPVVIVAYSGGFGPLLAVLAKGEVKPSRIHGIVMLDALYSGMDKFASWIANNRSAFFISSYTPHTRGRNVELEEMLTARSVPYSSELRRSHLQGMVTFLPAGDISHRDFVNHAWADYPIADVLERMDDLDQNIETARRPAFTPASATAAVATPPAN